jgi:hypothetical protein
MSKIKQVKEEIPFEKKRTIYALGNVGPDLNMYACLPYIIAADRPIQAHHEAENVTMHLKDMLAFLQATVRAENIVPNDHAYALGDLLWLSEIMAQRLHQWTMGLAREEGQRDYEKRRAEEGGAS